MNIRVSKDVENTINAAVRSGQFASADEMVDKLVREYGQRQQAVAKKTAKPAQRAKRARPAKPKQTPLTPDELNQRLLAAGLVTRLPDPAEDIDDDDDPPIVIQGEPLSETIIRERR